MSNAPEDVMLTMLNDSMREYDRVSEAERRELYERGVKNIIRGDMLSQSRPHARIVNINGADTDEAEPSKREPGGPVLLTGAIPVPPPPRFTVGHYVPEGHLSVIAGAGGAGKSYFMQHMAVCLTTGAPFLGLPTIKSNVLYVDFEENETDFHRRIIRVLNGMGFQGVLPGSMQYWSPQGSMLSSDTDAEIYKTLKQHVLVTGSDVLMIDSLTAACADDVKEAGDMTKVMTMLKTLARTVVVLDHIAAHNKNNKEASPYGSVMKSNKARSVMALTKDPDTETCHLRQTKQNETAKGAGIEYKMTFSLEKHLPAADYSWNSVRFEVMNPDQVDRAYNVKKIISNFYNSNKAWPKLKDIHAAAGEMGLSWGVKSVATVRRHIESFAIDMDKADDEQIVNHKGGVYKKKVGVADYFGTLEMVNMDDQNSLHHK